MIIKKLATYGFALALIGSVAACGSSSSGTSGGASDVGTGTGDPTADTSTAMSQALTTAGTAMGQAYTQAASSMSAPALIKAVTLDTITVDCDPSGTATIEGTVDTTFNMDLTLTYTDCADLNGELNMTASATVTDTTVDFSMSFDGDIGGYGCSTTFTDLTESFSIGEGDTFTYTIDGSVTSTCSGTTVTCTYDNETLDLSDTTVFEDNCVES